MKVLFFLFLLVLQDGPVFQSYESAKFESQKLALNRSKKLIFLDFHADWCGPCHYMDANVFTDLKIQNKLKKDFVAIKVNVDLPQSKALCSRYSINSYPSYVVIDSEGKSLLYIEGAFPAQNLLDELISIKK